MGPLTGYSIVEIGSIGPGPMCAMLLADLGANVLRIDRADAVGKPAQTEPKYNILHRSRKSLAVDLKKPAGVETVLRLIERADALIEGFRPGVMERLGLGPDVCLTRNQRLIYGRMTGWGQTGPLANAAGHDINYIALTGALHAIGPKERPMPPLNLVGDFGGGSLYLALGLLAGMLEAKTSGRGQVVDAAMVDGAASLMGLMYGWFASGYHGNERESNRLDGGWPNYGVYETKDGQFVCVGSNEPQFYAILLERLGLANEKLPGQQDRDHWPAMRKRFAAIFKTKTRDEWCRHMEGADACFAPVLSMADAPRHPHNAARKTFVDVAGVTQPAPAPRFSRTPGAIQSIAALPGEHSEAALKEWGFAAGEVADLIKTGAVVAAKR